VCWRRSQRSCSCRYRFSDLQHSMCDQLVQWEGSSSCNRRPCQLDKPSRRLTVSFRLQENAGNMSWRLPFLRMLSRYLDCSVLALRCTCRCEGERQLTV
jgi:hypothetical protein